MTPAPQVNTKTHALRILANSVDGKPLNYVNDLDIDMEDQAIYFTSSATQVVAHNPLGFYDTMRSYLLNKMAGDTTGR